MSNPDTNGRDGNQNGHGPASNGHGPASNGHGANRNGHGANRNARLANGNGRGGESDRSEIERRNDAHAKAVVEARLGRPPRDYLEATVVLEAWTGQPARSAMSTARGLVNLDSPPPRAGSAIEPTDDEQRRSVVAEGITLVLLILSVAAWAAPIRKHLGPDVLAHAIRVALPIAVALQWGLRSRYLSRRDGLSCLARDGLAFSALAILLVELPLVLLPGWGPVAAMLVPVWVGGTVLTRRGWGLIYAGILVLGTIALDANLSPYVVLGALTAITLLMCLAAILTCGPRTDERPGSVRRALLAALLGGSIGVLLVGDPSLGWGVHGVHPAIALLPSVIGSFWGGYYLWNFYDAIPRGLRGVPLNSASRAALNDPAISIFFGAVLRLLSATIVLSAVVIAIGGATRGSDAPSVFFAFGAVGLVSLLIGLLESFALQRAALIAAAAALATEFSCHYLVHSQVPGGALAVGATVGVLLTLPPLVARLARSGRVLATTLWIQ
jgi:hypothetical protein